MSKILQDVNVGDNLRKFREQKNLTQSEVCAQLAIMGRPMLQSNYSQIENGTRNIFASDLIALKKIFSVSIDDIFEGLKPVNKYDLKEKSEK